MLRCFFRSLTVLMAEMGTREDQLRLHRPHPVESFRSGKY